MNLLESRKVAERLVRTSLVVTDVEMHGISLAVWAGVPLLALQGALDRSFLGWRLSGTIRPFVAAVAVLTTATVVAILSLAWFLGISMARPSLHGTAHARVTGGLLPTAGRVDRPVVVLRDIRKWELVGANRQCVTHPALCLRVRVDRCDRIGDAWNR